MADDQNTDQVKAPKTKEDLLKSIRGEFDKSLFNDAKRQIQEKMKERREHEKAIKIIDTEIDTIWETTQKGF